MNFAGRLATETAAPAGILANRVNPGWLTAAVFLLLGIQNLLLWRFLGFAPAWLYPLALACFAGVALFLCRATTTPWAGPEVRTILLLGGASLLIFLLGGEGRLFYANADWQVRDAVLHDLIVNPWPFAYWQNNSLELLRAPIGMFLVPAVVGKAFGAAAADFTLLIQNSLLLTLLLSLGSTLFASVRARVVTLTVIVLFSGMDIIGEMLRSAASGDRIAHHLENWSGTQFSSHITQAFWVPQHALAGWFGALLFLLWREQRISLGQMYMMLPMLMLLSPLGVMGTLPFAAAAGIVTLIERRLRLSDFLLPAIPTLLCIPAILYLGAGAESVGIHLFYPDATRYLLFEILEVLFLIAGAAVIHRSNRREMATLVLVACCLVIVPLVQIGEGIDFTMRASITALAILSFQVSAAFSGASGAKRSPARHWLLGALAIGSITGTFEVVRAFWLEPSPRVQCSLDEAQYHVVELPRFSSNSTYFAPVEALPDPIRPKAPALVREHSNVPCWERPWMVPRFG
jgi:hypothetical protein